MTEARRLPPLAAADLTEEQAEAFAVSVSPKAVNQFLPPGPDTRPLPNGLSVLLHHPYLAKKWLPFSYSLLWEGELTHRQREVMVLRVAWRTRSRYEWVQHCVLGTSMFDIALDEIVAISEGRYDGFPALEQDLLTATDETLDNYRIGDDTWKRLASQLDATRLEEVALVIGSYTALAMVFESLGVELDDESDAAPFPRFPEE
jgi:4-carboxymuconolactone decarboxylase